MAQPRTALGGLPLTMEQNVIYALPTRQIASGSVTPADATLEVSNVNDGDEFAALEVAADGSFYTAAPFIRCTDAEGAIITVKYA